MATRDDRGPVGPFLLGGTSAGPTTGRHRSLATLSLRGIPERKLDGFVAALRAQGVRATRNGTKLIVPERDRKAVQGLIDLERLAPAGPPDRFDDRWWTGLVDAAAELADSYDEDEDALDPEAVDVFLDAHATFLRRGVGASLRPELHGRLLGLAEAVAAHIRSGRPAHAADAAARAVDHAARLR